MNNISFDFSKISFNAGLLLKEMQQRGIHLSYISKTSIIKAVYKNHVELLFDTYTRFSSYPVGRIIDDKFFSKKILMRYGFSVAQGNVFYKTDAQLAISYAEMLGYPVVLKPTVGSHGDNVYLDIRSSTELQEKIVMFQEQGAGNGFFLIEKYHERNEYRLFIAKNKFFAAVSRTPAHIIGDGKNNVLLLIKKENDRRMNPRNTCMCEIRLDHITFDIMEKNSITVDYIPKEGEKVFLRKNSNVSTGGNCQDITDIVHPSVKTLAYKILSSFNNLLFLGIDILCEDVTKPIDKNYYICELNSAPGLSLHMLPEKGSPRNVAGAIVDMVFSETTRI